MTLQFRHHPQLPAKLVDGEQAPREVAKFIIGHCSGANLIDSIAYVVARLRAESSKPSVEICMAERAEGNGGCGACALCCKEWRERAEAAERINEHTNLLGH
jgi:hypothetical protein